MSSVRPFPQRFYLPTMRCWTSAIADMCTVHVGDMFACGEEVQDGFEVIGHPHVAPSDPPSSRYLDLDERANTLHLLLRLLHEPPVDLVDSPVARIQTRARPASDAYSSSDSSSDGEDERYDFTRVKEVLSPHAIPFPVLEVLLPLADKYALSEWIAHRLYSHLAAHASSHALRVYGYAVRLGLPRVAATASTHLLHPPLTAYTAEEIRIIPTAEAYHQLARLHDFRIKTLADVLNKEDIFPYGYGECAWHAQATIALWRRTKEAVAKEMRAGRFPL